MNPWSVIAAVVMAAVFCSITAATAEQAARGTAPPAGNSKTGTIAGTVRFPGPPPPPALLRVNREQAFCGSLVPDRSLVAAADGGLRNAVVTLRGKGGEAEKGAPRTIHLDNIGCRFEPHVQAAPVGSRLRLLNSDAILHDAHARMGSRTLFNDGIPRWRQVTRTLRTAGVVKVICELHRAWMRAYIVVTPNRFFAVTGLRGRYAIAGIPPGTYDVRFWHERLAGVSRRVMVGPGTMRRVDVWLPRR